jgi:hypothetical protein
MKKHLASIAIAIAAITASAKATPVDIGGYFSIDIPSQWTVKIAGEHLYEPGCYNVYAADGRYVSIQIMVQNGSTALTLAYYNSLQTQADFDLHTRYNIRTGWTGLKYRKVNLNGLPALVGNSISSDGKVRMTEVALWAGDKFFFISIRYMRQIDGIVAGVDGTIDSIKGIVPAAAVTTPAVLPAGTGFSAGL